AVDARGTREEVRAVVPLNELCSLKMRRAHSGDLFPRDATVSRAEVAVRLRAPQPRLRVSEKEDHLSLAAAPTRFAVDELPARASVRALRDARRSVRRQTRLMEREQDVLVVGRVERDDVGEVVLECLREIGL